LKDDLVLNVNESLNVGFAPTDAYPSVISNFTCLEEDTKKIIAEWYASSTPIEFFGKQEMIREKKFDVFNVEAKKAQQANSLPFFRAQGYVWGGPRRRCEAETLSSPFS
jgi:hypothetical protein